ncbi:MAG: HAMP domain-containing histidine kinase [Firmicutes bacterium]|nr:HAMP domain-containing histidine kinase [Bacillota bacterium]
MNRVLRGLAIYLVVAVLMSLIVVSTIHGRLLLNGELFGYQLLSNQELKVFYEAIGDYIDIRQKLQDMNYETIMKTEIDIVDDFLDNNVNEIVGIYDEDNNWSLGSDSSMNLEKARRRQKRDENEILNILLIPVEVDEYVVFRVKTIDFKEVFLVMKQSKDAVKIINKYSFTVYRIQWIAIGLSLIVSFLPMIINLIVNYTIPIRRLRNATRLIAEGDYNFSIQTKGLDEIKSLSRDFEYMRNELEESRERENIVLENRKQLITNISHDLRTPITSIRGYVEGLLDGKANNPERMDRYLRTIYDKTAYLDKMIEDLFLFSQLDLGEYKIDARPWQANEVLKMLFEPIELWVEDSGWTFELEKPVSRGIISVDQMRLSQVVENIIQNSLKYGPENGKIHVKTFISNHNYNITISDNGRGIEKAALPYVLDAFYREDGSRQQSMGGSGLGLAICKKLVELHGGSINIDSEMGVGTSIILSFPLKG